MEQKPKIQSIIKYFLYAASVISLALSMLSIHNYLSLSNSITRDAKKRAFDITQKAGLIISHSFEQLKKDVDVIAQGLSSGTILFGELEKYISKKSSTINGFGVLFNPYAFDKKTKLYALYYVNKNSDPHRVESEILGDYSSEENKRFSLPIKQGETFLEPFYDPASKTIVIEYAAPFYDASGKKIGVVFANYSRDYVQELVATAYPSSFGYGEIVTKTGAFISHPNQDYVGQPKTGPQMAREAGNIKIAQAIEKALTGQEPLFEEDANWISEEKSWGVFLPMPHLPWLTASVLIISAVVGETPQLDRDFVKALLSSILFIVLALFILMSVYQCTAEKLWVGSAILTLGLIAGIAAIWHKAFKETMLAPDKIIIKSSLNQDQSLEKSNPENNSLSQKSLTIPTGIHIHQLAVNQNKITVNGYVWQKYPKNSSLALGQGIIFPQASKLIMNKMYEFSNKNYTTIGWSFYGTLEQSFDFHNYPFDTQKIEIQIWPKTLSSQVLLTPDFQAYKIFNPSGLPGINNKIKLQSWQLLQSYFSYEKENLITNFGKTSQGNSGDGIYQVDHTLPNLRFNVIINRYLYSSLILNILPIMIILILLFIVLFMIEVVKFYAILGSIISLFFSGLIAYMRYKSSSETEQLVFFDYLYFITQAIILVISTLTILYYKKSAIKWINFKGMLIPKLLFWPTTIISIFVLSLLFFY